MTRARASVLAIAALALGGCGLAGVGGLDGGLGRATPAHVRDLDAAPPPLAAPVISAVRLLRPLTGYRG